MSRIVCRSYTVSGKVQGVFFRATTAREAARLGLKGWARNLPGGDVEVLACGVADRLDRLGEWLAHGPPAARVDAVVARDENPDACRQLRDFRTG